MYPNECCGELHTANNPCRVSRLAWAEGEVKTAMDSWKAMRAGYALLDALVLARELTEEMDDEDTGAGWGLWETLPDDLHMEIAKAMENLVLGTTFREGYRKG